MLKRLVKLNLTLVFLIILMCLINFLYSYLETSYNIEYEAWEASKNSQ